MNELVGFPRPFNLPKGTSLVVAPEGLVRTQGTDQYEPLSAGIALLTALSQKPKHLEVQTRCLDTWLNIGCRIVAQNTTEEIEQLREVYPQVHDWIQCDDVSTEYDYPTQRLYNLAESVSQLGNNAAIINSDIEILCSQKQLKEFVSVSHNEFVLGIRWNYETSPASAKEFEWGLDLMTVSPEQLLLFPADMPFAIGQPMWDYALPELLIRAGFKAKIPHERVLFHRDHPQHWNKHSHQFGKDWLSRLLGNPFWDDVQFRRNLDPDYLYHSEQGKYLYNHWQPLHRYAPEHAGDWDSCKASRWYFEDWQPSIPKTCGCAEKWAKLPPPSKVDFLTPESFFEWSWTRHNQVSREHSNKPQITLDQAYRIHWMS